MSALLVGLAVAPPAEGAPITVTLTATWRAADHAGDPPAPSPFYDCPGWAGGGLICRWIWDQGLEVRSLTFLPMYGDSGPFYDAFGVNLPVGPSGSGVLGIEVSCLTGLQPCFQTFTPRSINVGLDSDAGVALISFNDGMLTSGGGVVNFVGDQWKDSTGLTIGLFLPDECADPDTNLDCSSNNELALHIRSLTFDVTVAPEPASVLLVGTGLLAVLRRYRRA